MPKCYSDQERENIRKRLKEEAAACMGQFGIRRITVDEYLPYPAVRNPLSCTRGNAMTAEPVSWRVRILVQSL